MQHKLHTTPTNKSINTLTPYLRCKSYKRYISILGLLSLLFLLSDCKKPSPKTSRGDQLKIDPSNIKVQEENLTTLPMTSEGLLNTTVSIALPEEVDTEKLGTTHWVALTSKNTPKDYLKKVQKNA